MTQTIPIIPKKFSKKVEFINSNIQDDGLIYIYVKCISKLSPRERGTLLLDLEDEMYKRDNRIRIWHISLGDKNSLRNLRGITLKNQ